MGGITPILPATSGRRSPRVPRQNPRPALSSSEHAGRTIGRGDKAFMIPTQRLPASLTPLDVALAALLNRLAPAAAGELPLAGALRGLRRGIPPLKGVPRAALAASHAW